MKASELRGIIDQALGQIAPEIEAASLRTDLPMRDQFDFDSVDFLNFAAKLQETLKMTIVEADYPRLASIDGCLAYLCGRLESARGTTPAA